MKKLTQAVFNEAPDWVKSAAVDGDGYLTFFNQPTANLEVDSNYDEGIWGQKLSLGEIDYRISVEDAGYDTIDWQHSALDRE